MIRRSLLLSCLVTLALATWAVVQSAPTAAEGEPEIGALGAFQLKGTHGFSMFVLAVSKPQFKQGEAIVVVSKHDEAALYLSAAKVEPTSIEADLGSVGEIAVQFEPSSPPERVNASCKRGGSVTFEPGAWVGTIDFVGEEGFTEVHRERVKAEVSPFVEAGCGGRSIGETMGSDVLGARLVARSASKQNALFLQANRNRRGGRVYLEASIEERRSGLTVSREVAGYYPPGAFQFSPSLQSAILDPPAPFGGHATFHRNAKPANRLTGNLSIDFPGRADVPLAGGRFKATLVHAKRTEETTR
jgi:hypothetical protein